MIIINVQLFEARRPALVGIEAIPGSVVKESEALRSQEIEYEGASEACHLSKPYLSSRNNKYPTSQNSIVSINPTFSLLKLFPHWSPPLFTLS